MQARVSIDEENLERLKGMFDGVQYRQVSAFSAPHSVSNRPPIAAGFVSVFCESLPFQSSPKADLVDLRRTIRPDSPVCDHQQKRHGLFVDSNFPRSIVSIDLGEKSARRHQF
uniref:Uncharacterized protein n=1 Tax=Plectus sambesii TaxID=2011161 RepID=A0A914XHS4_9BILA